MTATQTAAKNECDEATCTKHVTHLVRGERGHIDFRLCGSHASIARTAGFGYVEPIYG